MRKHGDLRMNERDDDKGSAETHTACRAPSSPMLQPVGVDAGDRRRAALAKEFLHSLCLFLELWDESRGVCEGLSDSIGGPGLDQPEKGPS